jgi:hypothetical protein
MISANAVLRTADPTRPIPASTPMAAVSHTPAAVVRPRTSRRSSSLRIVPAPRNPMPAMTP